MNQYDRCDPGHPRSILELQLEFHLTIDHILFIFIQDPTATQEELLAMAVEYLRARRTNNIGSSATMGGSNSFDTKYSDHTATATPHSKRSRRRQQQHHQHNGT